MDQNGNLSSSGRHILYLDLMGRKSQLSTQAYQTELNTQRWTLYKSFYLESKRKTKLTIPAYQNCDSAKRALTLTDELPQTPEDIAQWGEENGATGPVSAAELEMTISNLAFNCNIKLSATDSTSIASHLEAYFNSNPHNMFRLILRADVGINSHLVAVQTILNGYNCSLTTVSQDDPITCAEEEANLVVNPLLVPSSPTGCSADITSACYPGWAKATGTPNTNDGGGQGRFFIWAFPQTVTSEAIRGSFIRPLEPGVKYQMCFKYSVEKDATTYTNGTVDQAYVQLSRSNAFINALGSDVSTSRIAALSATDTVAVQRQAARSVAQAVACILPGAKFPDPIIIDGQTVSTDKIWNGQGLTNAGVYQDVCITFTATEASTYFYFSIMSCNANVYQGINIRDLVVKKILPHPNTVEFEGETVCLNYDTANTALKGFTFKVDWNKEIQKCLDNAEQENTQLIEYAVDRVIQEAMSEYSNAYRSKCMENITEGFTYTYQPKEYHYTLFYYDQSGKLVQSVPPEGVKPLTPAQVNSFLAGTPVDPVHQLTSRYQYSSIDQVIWQKTPDANESRFWYDDKAQLRLHQNAEQQRNNRYSYARFDEQGRSIESGEMETNNNLATLLDAIE